MKQRIFMYLFIFALLVALFMYVSSKNEFEVYEASIKDYQSQIAKLEDSLDVLDDEILDLRYFTITNKEDALSYFENKGYNTEQLIPFIKDELYKLNVYEGEEHPLIPYPSMTDGKMLINKVSIVNHRWILTDFSDGKHWGELFLGYEITDDEQLKFRLIDYLIYPF